MTRERRDAAKVGRKRSRRRFLKLVAASSVAALAGRASGVAAAATTSTKKPHKGKSAPAPAPAVSAEIKSQKDSLDKALKVIREYPLPAGSEMALVFVPLGPASASDDATRAK